MLLNDIGRKPTTTLKKINKHLESNYGFKIAENTSDKDLVSIMETIKDEITELKMKGDDAKASPEISKRLLVLEGVKILHEYAIMQFQSKKLEPLVALLVDEVVGEFEKSGTSIADFDDEVNSVMKKYRSSEFRFPDEYIEKRVRDGAMRILKSAGDAPEAEVDETQSGAERGSEYSLDFRYQPKVLPKQDPWAAHAEARRKGGVVHAPAVRSNALPKKS